ncbi:MAG: hypothetical protein ACOYOV_05180 [Bacteroidales bacterium]
MMLKKNTNVRQFLELALYYDMTSEIEEISKMDVPKIIISKYIHPDSFDTSPLENNHQKHEVPLSLDHITFGQRIDLLEINSDQHFFFKPLEILASFKIEQIALLKASDVIRYSQFVISELKRFEKRDNETLKYKFDKEEIEAGIKEMNHGIFGTIDMIAKRMNIAHDEVLELSQSKVYMMLKIDIDNANYQKKLRDAFNKKQS